MELLGSFKSFTDPLRNGAAAERWLRSAAKESAAVLCRRASEIVARYPAEHPLVAPEHADALLKFDAALEPAVQELTREYTTACDHPDRELRLWQQLFDVPKAFFAAYRALLQAGYPRVEDKDWRALLPWVMVRLLHHRRLDGKLRLFRFSRWSGQHWRELHELYEMAHLRGWQRDQLVLGPAQFARPGQSVEQEYLLALLLMRLDSGNFTADQVQWITEQLDDCAPALALEAKPGAGTTFCVDLTSLAGLYRNDRPPEDGHVCFVDTSPIYTRVVERTRWLPEADGPDDGQVPAAGELPIREQRLLLVRLAALYGPETLAIAPRAPRYNVNVAARVVFGLEALCSVVGTAGRAGADPIPSVRAAAEGATPVGDAGPETLSGEHGEAWTLADASDSGFRLTTRIAEAPARLGDLVGMRNGVGWTCGVVRRIQRVDDDEVALGIEIVGRQLVPVLMRTWMGDVTSGQSGAGRPFLAIYLPADAGNRLTSERGLVGPPAALAPESLLELQTAKGSYLVRCTRWIEGHPGWAWTLFRALRRCESG